MKLVILDNFAMIPGDLDWSPFYKLADTVESYGYLPREQQLEKVKNADFLIMNKTIVDEELLCCCQNLKWIGIIATGTDNVDLHLCRKMGIDVANVPGYSGPSVAQLAFALLLELCQSPAAFNNSVQNGIWRTNIPKSYKIAKQTELAGKTIGIIGYGNIGRAVCNIALAFGMKVLVYTRTPNIDTQGIHFVSLDSLLQNSDIITLHCPCTKETQNIINETAIQKMKHGALLINTSRGKLVCEQAVAKALQSGKLGGFGTDVLAVEPIQQNSPFKNTPNTIITPHIAWATTESLKRLMDIVYKNLDSYVQGFAQNIVN